MKMTTSEIKELMDGVYKKFGIKKTPVVTQLEKEYGISINPCKIKQNEKRVSGYCIL